MPHCGTCKHTEQDREDLTKVVCFGGPPTLVVIPVKGPNGMIGAQQVLQRACIPKTERSCGAYEPKEISNGHFQEPFGVVDNKPTIEEGV